MLIAENISIKRHFRDELRLNISNLSFELELGKITSIIGQSGVGKSTIASILSGLLKPDEGDVKLENKLVNQPNTPIAFVIQDYKNAVFPWLTVEENIKIGEKKPIQKNGSYTYEEIVGLFKFPEKILKDHPNHLSGGQIQKVQIARALLTGCKYFILDEPTSSLDMKFSAELQSVLISLVQKFNVGILLITHNIEEAIFLADKIVVLKEMEDKQVCIRNYDGFSHQVKDISEAQELSEYRNLFNNIYQYLFYEDKKRNKI